LSFAQYAQTGDADAGCDEEDVDCVFDRQSADFFDIFLVVDADGEETQYAGLSIGEVGRGGV
jgi:hypothetical protein